MNQDQILIMNHPDLTHDVLRGREVKVKCKNIYNQHTKEFEDTSPWLTIGKEYIVLEVEVSSLEKTFYRLVGDNDNKMPALYKSSQFEIVDGGIPKNWEVSQLSDGSLILCPKAWQAPGFWEDCYDHDLKALEIYKREARIIYETQQIHELKEKG